MYNEFMIVVLLVAQILICMFLGFKFGVNRGREATLKILHEADIINIILEENGNYGIYSGNHFDKTKKIPDTLEDNKMEIEN
jgi:hypothetical protein